jgi:CubicO group peptidase (beta-lactamase class C family)
MKPRRLSWVIVAAILTVFHASVPAQQYDPTTNYSVAADRVTRMDQILSSYADLKQLIGNVLVAEDGRVLLDKSYGFANMEWQIPNTVESKFRLGSITKQFTAASILLLEQQGKLSTDDLVKKYMLDAPVTWDKITIYQLLTHTAGIPSFTGFPDYHANEVKPYTPEQLVVWFKDKPLDFQPGTEWRYSNSGYVLLGYLIEKISGKAYGQFVKENILDPVGMKDTGYDSSTEIIPHRAMGYSHGPGGQLRNSGYVDMSVPFSAGALYSTTHDLLKWEQALFAEKLLNAVELKKMTSPFKNNYACGLSVAKLPGGQPVIKHAGGIEGFNAVLAYYPDHKLTVMVLSNQNLNVPDEIGDKLAVTAYGGKMVLPSERVAIAVAPELLAANVGKYKIARDLDLTITLEGAQLMAQVTGQAKAPLFAETPTKFFLKIADAEMEFVKENGKVVYLMIYHGGQAQKVMKE